MKLERSYIFLLLRALRDLRGKNSTLYEAVNYYELVKCEK